MNEPFDRFSFLLQQAFHIVLIDLGHRNMANFGLDLAKQTQFFQTPGLGGIVFVWTDVVYGRSGIAVNEEKLHQHHQAFPAEIGLECDLVAE